MTSIMEQLYANIVVDEVETPDDTILNAQQTNQVCTDCTVSITPNRLDTSGPDYTCGF